jgi:ABC-type nitrate/sulfonate/bicarbonate transport system ATPase subunit
MSATPLLSVKNLGLHYGNSEHPVLQDVSFSMQTGEIVALLGASGCGKTSLLNVIAGFLGPQAGEIHLRGALSTAPSPAKAVVFQEHALFPWLKVWENVAFGLKAQGVPRQERRRATWDMLAKVGLAGCEEMLPAALSGGMKQRVALARVLVLRPCLLLMDEPFASLDALTREDMHELLLRLHQELSPAILFVTHDVSEALKLADRILIFGNGQGRIAADRTAPHPRPRDMQHPQILADLVELRALLRQAFPSDGVRGRSGQ